MDSSFLSQTESLPCEAPARPSKPSSSEIWSIPYIKDTLGQDSSRTLDILMSTFGVRESAIGLMALLHQITTDLASLRLVFSVPEWAKHLDTLYSHLKSISSVDHIRDLRTLQSQPSSPLRNFLTPFAVMKPSQHRAIRAVRGLATLQLLAKKEHLVGALADQLARCLKGRSLQGLGPEHIAPDQVREISRAFAADSPEARLLTYIFEPLEMPLNDPFIKPARIPSEYLAKVTKTSGLSTSTSEKETDTQQPQSVPDPLKGFLAEETHASTKIFSGIPDLYRGLLPFELESIFSGMRLQWNADTPDEYLAAWLTLLTRVMPQNFDRVPLHADEGAGLWVDMDRGYVAWNLDEVLSSHKSETPFFRSANDRYFLIPMPLEIHRELKQRFRPEGNRTLASLFRQQAKHLGVSTKRFLRGLSISSHRPTLSRLSDSWARYLLSLCRDEVYASALGIDFTVGSPSNLHYATLRGMRIRTILAEAYRRLGFTLGCENVPDIPSRRLPAQETVAALVEHSLQRVADIITQFPRRATIGGLKAAHNEIALAIYGVFKLLTGGRALQEENVTYSRIDLASGLTELCDKRTAPYHERRVICLPPTLRRWMKTYVGWLRLAAYRLAHEDRELSAAITSTLNAPWDGDRLPFFFRFACKGIRSLGSDSLGPIFDAAGLKNNSGRHFVDAIFRAQGLDSAAIMGWMGRGYPGQEIYGRWSAVIPLNTLAECASAIERWLSELSLPPAPELTPRATEGLPPRHKADQYVPALLRELPDALTVKMTGMVEPCPYQAQHVLEASLFPRLYQAWRSAAPPTGWPGVAMSLVFEDGILLEEELFGVLNEMRQGVVYRHQHHYFVDTRIPTYGIRRVWLSAVTIRLLHQIGARGSEGAAPATIDEVARKFVTKVLRKSGTNGIHFIQRSLQAFQFFQIPTMLHAWMRGDSFARVSRPQVVARELFGCCEPPSFGQRFSRRERQRFNDFSTLHRRANEILASGTADKSVLAQFERELAEIQPNYTPDSLEWLVVGYARYLCNNQSTLASVSRYLTACRPFLQLIVANLSERDRDQIDWQALVLQRLGGEERGMDKAPDRAAINHCLAWLGVDERIYRRSGPPPSAFSYADRMTEREGKIAISLLRSQQKTPGDLWHRASVALSLLLAAEIRWDELACLRMCDFCFASGRAHLVVTRESGARLKSPNAQRVIPLVDIQLVTDLSEIYAQRDARFPHDSLVPFFGDDTEHREHASLDKVHDLIADALWCASGSGTLRIHDTRAAGLTRKVANLLAPATRKAYGRTLDLRQAAYQFSAQAAHVTPQVSVENYVHDLDVRRRQWQDHILEQFVSHTRPAFAAGVTGVREGTYRQRARRSSTAKQRYCFLEGFNAAQPLESGATVRELDELVVSDLTVAAELAEHHTGNELVAAGIYIGLLLLGESSESARLAAALPIAQANYLETKLTSHQRGRISPLRGHAAISREEFITAALKVQLVVAMQATAPHITVVRRLMTAVDLMGAPWELMAPEDLLDAATWLDPLRSAGIEPRLQLKSLGQSRLDDHWLQRFLRAGLQTRIHPASHFPRGVAGRVKFGRLGTGKQVSQFRASPQLTYLVSTSLFALGLLTEDI